MLVITAFGLLHTTSLSDSQQPLPVGCSADGALPTRGVVSILHSIHIESTQLQQVLLGIGDEAGAVVEAMRLGQVCCCLATGIP